MHTFRLLIKGYFFGALMAVAGYFSRYITNQDEEIGLLIQVAIWVIGGAFILFVISGGGNRRGG